MSLVVAIVVAALALAGVIVAAYLLELRREPRDNHCESCGGTGHMPFRLAPLDLGLTGRCPACTEPPTERV